MKFKLLLLAALCLSLSSGSIHAMQKNESDGPEAEKVIDEKNSDADIEVFPTIDNAALGTMIAKFLYNNKLLIAGVCTSALLAMRKYDSTKELIGNLPLIKNGAHEAALVATISHGAKLLSLTYIINEILNYKPKSYLNEQLNDLASKMSIMSLSAIPSIMVVNSKVQKDTAKYLTVTIMPKNFLRFIIRFLPKTKKSITKTINMIAQESGQAAALLSTIILYKLMTKLPGWMQALYIQSRSAGATLLLELLEK